MSEVERLFERYEQGEAWGNLLFEAGKEIERLREVQGRISVLADERDRLRRALAHIAQSVGARANGQDARLMAKYARDALSSDV